jgi:hypothetical protein
MDSYRTWFESGAKQTPKERHNSEVECCTRKQKRPPPTYRNPWPMVTNNFFAPLRDFPKKNQNMGSEGNSTKTPKTNDGTGKGSSPPIILTWETKLINLQREIRSVVSGGISSGTRITTKSIMECNAMQIPHLEKSPLLYVLHKGG